MLLIKGQRSSTKKLDIIELSSVKLRSTKDHIRMILSHLQLIIYFSLFNEQFLQFMQKQLFKNYNQITLADQNMFNFSPSKTSSLQQWIKDPTNKQIFGDSKMSQLILNDNQQSQCFFHGIPSTQSIDHSSFFQTNTPNTNEFQSELHSSELQNYGEQCSNEETFTLTSINDVSRLSMEMRINSQVEFMGQQNQFNSENRVDQEVSQNDARLPSVRGQCEDRNVLPPIKKIFRESLLDIGVDLVKDPFLKSIFYQTNVDGKLSDKRKTSQAQLQTLVKYAPLREVWQQIKKDRSYQMFLEESKARLSIKKRAMTRIEYFFSLIKTNVKKMADIY